MTLKEFIQNELTIRCMDASLEIKMIKRPFSTTNGFVSVFKNELLATRMSHIADAILNKEVVNTQFASYIETSYIFSENKEPTKRTTIKEYFENNIIFKTPFENYTIFLANVEGKNSDEYTYKTREELIRKWGNICVYGPTIATKIIKKYTILIKDN